MYAASSNRGETGISRRSFVQLTVGSIVMLPTVTNALLLPSREALADEGDAAAGLFGSSSIHIVRTNELGLVVRDVSRPGDAANLIPGAYVKITSRYNGATADGYTDDKGAITFDLTTLAEDEGKNGMPAVYAFNGTIEVNPPGYRMFRVDLMRVKGGAALGVPTQPRKSGVPYPVSASFDEWDVLYTEGDAADFVSCTGNDINHTIGFRLADCPANAAITAGVFANGAQVASASAKAAADGTATLAFVDKFLLPSSAAALPVGSDNTYTMRYTVGSTTYEVPIKPTVSEAPPEAQDQQIKKDLELTPFNDAAMFTGLYVPEGTPLVGGAGMKMWQPMWYVDFVYNPFGFMYFKAMTPEWGYTKDNGQPDPNGWKFHPKSSPLEQYKKQLSKMDEQREKTFAALAKDGKIKQIGFSQTLSVTAQLELMGVATWDYMGKESRGRAQLALKVGANYSFMETFWAGPIPVVIRFSIGLNGTFAGEVGYVSPSVWSFDKYRWDWGSTGFDMQICFPPTLSLGIGIGGLFSISVKGALNITFYLHHGPLPEGYKDLPSPHLRVAGKMKITLELEILFFTQTYPIWESDWPDWYNNWKGKLPENVRGFSSPLKGAKLGDALSNATIITSDSLAAVAEFSTGGVASLESPNPQGTVLTHYKLNKLEDGEETLVADLLLSDSKAQEFGRKPNVLLATQADGGADGGRTVVSGQGGDGSANLVAGSATALTAQDDSQVEFVLRPASLLAGADGGSAADYQTTIWETKLPSATPVGEHNYQVIPQAAPGVLSLGKERGILTSTDVRVADNVLSASHLKLFSAGGNGYILRIGVVMVKGKARTRIISERVDTGEKRVIDFKTNIDRDDCFDYDFDISTTYVNGEELINMVVISGPRPSGDNTSLTSAAGKTFLTLLTCKNWGNDPVFTGWTFPASFFDTIGEGGTVYKHLHYSCPQIRQIVGVHEGVQYSQAVVTFLVRASRHEWALTSDDPDLTQTGVGLLFFNDYDQSVYVSGMSYMLKLVRDEINDSSLTEVKLSEQAGGWQVLTLKGSQQTYYGLLNIDPVASVMHGEAIPLVLNLTLARLGAYEDKVSRLVAVPAQNHFLTCVDGVLKKVDVVQDGDKATLSFTDVGGEPININDFGVTSSGDVLYWPASRDDGGYVIDENGDAVQRSAEESELNLIMGARIRNGEVGRAMTLSEVSHPMHRIRSFERGGSYLSFISSTTIDSNAGKGEMWYTAVPWVRCAVLVEAEPYATVLAKGDHLAFNLMLRNEGNCFLSGVELSVAEVNHEPFDRMRLNFSKDNTLESEWNPRGDDGELQNVEYDWALAPGMSSRYYAEYVTIPDDWEGDKEIEIFISAVYAVGLGQLSTSGEMSAQAEDVSIEFIPDQRVRGFISARDSSRVSGYEGEYGPADITVLDSSEAPVDEGAGQRSATKGSPSASGKSGVPGTGDVLPLAALAAAGAIGAGAARRALKSKDE